MNKAYNRKKMTYICPKCSEEFYDRLKYCPSCGFDFTTAQKKCPKCHSQVPVDSAVCPECGLDFEQYSYLVPKIVVFGLIGLAAVILLVTPWVWKAVPWMHDKGEIREGFLRSESQVSPEVPMFLEWQSGERYIEIARKGGGNISNTDYMMELVPLPPAVVFHYDLPLGEKVWIIRRKKYGENDWVLVGRYAVQQGKYGWVHGSNLNVTD
jgi:hypothetical protein